MNNKLDRKETEEINNEGNVVCKYLFVYDGVCTNPNCPLVADFIDSDTHCLICKYKVIK